MPVPYTHEELRRATHETIAANGLHECYIRPLVFRGYGTMGLFPLEARVDVAIGQTVQQGQRIGAIGATGVATGDHLHFEVRVDNTPTDPMGWLPPRS